MTVLDFPTFDTPDEEEDAIGYEDPEGHIWNLYEVVFSGPSPDGDETSFGIELWATDQEHANTLLKNLQTQELVACKVVWEEDIGGF